MYRVSLWQDQNISFQCYSCSPSCFCLNSFPKKHTLSLNDRALCCRYLYKVDSTPFLFVTESGDGNGRNKVKWKELASKYIQTNKETEQWLRMHSKNCFRVVYGVDSKKIGNRLSSQLHPFCNAWQCIKITRCFLLSLKYSRTERSMSRKLPV